MTDSSSTIRPLDPPEQPLAFLWQGRWLIVSATILGALLGIFFAQSRGTVWRAKSVLLVERGGPGVVGQDPSLGHVLPRNYAKTQAELLRSSPVLSEALKDPTLAGNSILEHSTNPISWLKRNLDVSVGDEDDLITVSLDSSRPAAACQVVNKIVDSYRAFLARGHAEVGEVLERLTSELDRYEDNVQAHQLALVEFHKANPDVQLHEDMASVSAERFKQLNTSLTQAELGVLEAKAAWEAATELASNPALLRRIPILGAQGYDLSDSGDNAQARRLDDLRQLRFRLQSEVKADASRRISGLQGERERLLTQVTPAHPAVREIDASLALLRQSAQTGDSPEDMTAAIDDLQVLADENEVGFAKAFVDALRQRFQSAVKWRDGLAQEVADQERQILAADPKRAEYRALEARVARASKIADLLYSRVNALDINEALGDVSSNQTEALVFEYATPESAIVSSSKRALAAVATFLGFMIGAALAWLRSLGDQRLRSFDELSAIMPVLSTVPDIDVHADGAIATWRDDPEYYESMRSLRVALTLGESAAAHRVFQVASAESGDGKSLIAAGLAMAMAQSGKRTLLIDGDLRQPSQSTLFGTEETGGLVDVLKFGVGDLETRATGFERLDLLPAGYFPHDIGELMSVARFSAAIEQLKQEYDIIIVDSPPLLRLTDGRIIAAASDETLLVVRSGKTTRKLVDAATASARSVGGNVSGSVLNSVRRARMLGTSVQAYGALVIEE